MLGEWLFPVSPLMGSRRLGTSAMSEGFSVNRQGEIGSIGEKETGMEQAIEE